MKSKKTSQNKKEAKKVSKPVAKKAKPVAKKVKPIAKKTSKPIAKKVAKPIAKQAKPVAKKISTPTAAPKNIENLHHTAINKQIKTFSKQSKKAIPEIFKDFYRE